jgi:hypothetical protein
LAFLCVCLLLCLHVFCPSVALTSSSPRLRSLFCLS